MALGVDLSASDVTSPTRDSGVRERPHARCGEFGPEAASGTLGQGGSAAPAASCRSLSDASDGQAMELEHHWYAVAYELPRRPTYHQSRSRTDPLHAINVAREAGPVDLGPNVAGGVGGSQPERRWRQKAAQSIVRADAVVGGR
jgi:hypothetical protein